MASLCLPCRALVQTDLGGLMSSGNDSMRLAKEIMDLSDQNLEKGESLKQYSESIRLHLAELGSKMKPHSFVAIMDLLNEEKMEETLGTAREMQGVADEALGKSVELSGSIQKSIDCIPEEVKEMVAEDDEEQGEDAQDLDFEAEISQLKECTESLRGMDVFSAATKGTAAFDGLISKSSLVQTIMDKIKSLCTKVAQLSQSFMTNDCCAQIQAGVSSLKDMMKCLKLSKLINTFADGAKRLMAGILDLFNVSKDTFEKFMEQFEAAKKLQKFTNGLKTAVKNPMSAIMSGVGKNICLG